MACEVNISEFYALTDSGGAITAIIVRGTATECDVVAVTIILTRTSETDYTYEQVKVAVVAGAWTAQFLAAAYPGEFPWGFKCGDTLEVWAANDADWKCLTRTFNELPCREASECPTVTWGDIDVSACDSDGNRQVTGSVTLEFGGSDTITAELLLDGSSVDSGTGTGTLTLEIDQALSEGTYYLSLNIIVPEGCDSDRVEVVVEACGCPEFDVKAEVSKDCNADGSRSVTLTATRLDSGDAALVYWDKDGDESVVDSPGELIYGGETYSISWDYPEGDHEAKLRIEEPESCDPIPVAFTVDTCGGGDPESGDEDEPKPGDGEETKPGDGSDGDSGTGGGCLCTLLGMLWAALLIGIVILVLASTAFPPLLPWALVLLATAIGLSILYIRLCGFCSWAKWTIVGVLGAVAATGIGFFAAGVALTLILQILAALLGVSVTAVVAWFLDC